MEEKYSINEILDAVNDIHRSEPKKKTNEKTIICLLYTSPSPRDVEESRMPSSA